MRSTDTVKQSCRGSWVDVLCTEDPDSENMQLGCASGATA